MRFLFVISFLIALFGCNQNQTPSYRDVVFNKYVKMVDSSGRYDTTDRTYKALKAYVENDTNTLKEIDSFILTQSEKRSYWTLWDSDIPLPKLNEFYSEEAYRFIFSILGSPAYEVITIFKKDSIISLHYLFYTRDYDSLKINRHKEFNRNISETQWKNLISKIYQADFWDLKNENGYRGRDGNDLTVIGYKKSANYQRYHSVHRWRHSSINASFFYVYFSLLNKTERQFVNE